MFTLNLIAIHYAVMLNAPHSMTLAQHPPRNLRRSDKIQVKLFNPICHTLMSDQSKSMKQISFKDLLYNPLAFSLLIYFNQYMCYAVCVSVRSVSLSIVSIAFCLKLIKCDHKNAQERDAIQFYFMQFQPFIYLYGMDSN